MSTNNNSSSNLNSISSNSGGPGAPSGSAPAAASSDAVIREIYGLVQQLLVPEQREYALTELSKRRESCSEMAPILWHSFGTIAALLQEIVSIYPLLSTPQHAMTTSNRVCNALALLQCVASHPDTKLKLMHGKKYILS